MISVIIKKEARPPYITAGLFSGQHLRLALPDHRECRSAGVRGFDFLAQPAGQVGATPRFLSFYCP
jgi:hypothetical protein